jgi:hypothetical protein
VSLDLASLLSTQRAIRVARCDYDFARDGGAAELIPVQSEIIPAGSIVLAEMIYTTETIVKAGGGVIALYLEGTQLLSASLTAEHQKIDFNDDGVAIVTLGDRAINVNITVSAVTAGKFTAWIFYLPTTD